MEYEKMKEKADKLGVSVEVYLVLRKSNRKMRYLLKERKAERILIEGDKVTFIPGKEDSYDRLLEIGVEFAAEGKSVEDIVEQAALLEQLPAALERLTSAERQLIEELFFSRSGEGKSEQEIAETLGITQQGVSYRKVVILKKLRKYMED